MKGFNFSIGYFKHHYHVVGQPVYRGLYFLTILAHEKRIRSKMMELETTKVVV